MNAAARATRRLLPYRGWKRGEPCPICGATSSRRCHGHLPRFGSAVFCQQRTSPSPHTTTDGRSGWLHEIDRLPRHVRDEIASRWTAPDGPSADHSAEKAEVIKSKASASARSRSSTSTQNLHVKGGSRPQSNADRRANDRQRKQRRRADPAYREAENARRREPYASRVASAPYTPAPSPADGVDVRED